MIKFLKKTCVVVFALIVSSRGETTCSRTSMIGGQITKIEDGQARVEFSGVLFLPNVGEGCVGISKNGTSDRPDIIIKVSVDKAIAEWSTTYKYRTAAITQERDIYRNDCMCITGVDCKGRKSNSPYCVDSRCGTGGSDFMLDAIPYQKPTLAWSARCDKAYSVGCACTEQKAFYNRCLIAKDTRHSTQTVFEVAKNIRLWLYATITIEYADGRDTSTSAIKIDVLTPSARPFTSVEGVTIANMGISETPIYLPAPFIALDEKSGQVRLLSAVNEVNTFTTGAVGEMQCTRDPMQCNLIVNDICKWRDSVLSTGVQDVNPLESRADPVLGFLSGVSPLPKTIDGAYYDVFVGGEPNTGSGTVIISGDYTKFGTTQLYLNGVASLSMVTTSITPVCGEIVKQPSGCLQCQEGFSFSMWLGTTNHSGSVAIQMEREYQGNSTSNTTNGSGKENFVLGTQAVIASERMRVIEIKGTTELVHNKFRVTFFGSSDDKNCSVFIDFEAKKLDITAGAQDDVTGTNSDTATTQSESLILGLPLPTFWGIIGGVLAFLIICFVCCCCFCRRRRVSGNYIPVGKSNTSHRRKRRSSNV